jgi:pimeloyl-ACP methyl ester carboxylesterase
METDIGDLEAVVEQAGGSALLIATADGANRAAKLAVRRPDLIGAVASFGTAPLSRPAFEGEEGMATSDTVIDAFVEMLDRNYRGGMRSLLEATNPQASDEELRERVHMQAEFCPSEAALGRFVSWVEDDPREAAGALGNRLWIFAAQGLAGAWLPPTEELARLVEEWMPQASVVQVGAGAGPISAPRETAEEIRQVTAPLRAGA